MSNDRPTITVDLETLAKADLCQMSKGYDEINSARKTLRDAIAERRREIKPPAPEPWQAVGVVVRDANDKHLSERDTQRAAMAPELASALRCLTGRASQESYKMETSQELDGASQLLARFDSPGG